MLQKTLGHSIFGFGAMTTKGRRKVDSVWISGMYNPDGQTFKDRYGFTLEETNGSPVGERGPSDDLQSVIQHPDNPFMIENNSTYQVRTYWDVCDCRYVMIGDQTAWDKIIMPILDKYRSSLVVMPSVVTVNSLPPIASPVSPPVVDPCQAYRDHISVLQGANDVLEDNLGEINNLARTCRNAARVDLTARGGGAPVVQLRKLLNKIVEITGPL